MARVNAFGFEDAIKGIYAELEQFPQIREKMLIEGGKRLAEEVQMQMLMYGVRDLGTTYDSINHGEVQYAAGGSFIEVWPRGMRKKDKNHRKSIRNAMVAFLVEYGTSTTQARPFMSAAVKEAADDVAEVMMEVWKGRDKQ